MSVCKCVLCAAIMVSSAAAMAQASTPPSSAHAATKPSEATPSKRHNLSDRAATKAGQQAADPAMATRDWAAIDKNKDNLISPDEMEAYLKANPGPLAKSR
jgi:hypothetical protein